MVSCNKPILGRQLADIERGLDKASEISIANEEGCVQEGVIEVSS